MLNRIVPSVLALSLGSAALLSGADNDMTRDEHARAVRALIDLGAKISAKRQMDLWGAAGYTDLSPSLKKALLDGYEQAFEPTFDAKRMKAYEAPGLPKVIYDVTTGGNGIDAIVKLLNETRKVLDPDAAAPMVRPTAEKLAALQRNFTRLGSIFEKEFAANLDKVKAHKDQEDKLWDLDDKKDAKLIRDIQIEAVNLRMDTMRVFHLAHMALREAETRGQDFNVDPQPTKALLSAFCKQYQEIIADWDFQWGEFHPQLAYYLAVFLCEGARHQIKGITVGDAEAALLRTIDLDMEAYSGTVREEVQTLQVEAWATALRWRLEMGDAASYDRGLALFEDFKRRFGDDKDVGLDIKDVRRAAAVASIYITAGRLQAAKGDSATAKTMWAQVKGSKNPLAWQAGTWMSQKGEETGGWGNESLPADPSLALTVARTMIGEARTASPMQQRQYYIDAALGLRNGILGLNTSAFQSQFIENGPSTYRYYAYSLAQVGMIYHAAAAGQEGMRLIAARITDQANPWKDKAGKWTKPGEQVQALVSSALTYASKLNSTMKSSASKRLFDECVTLAQKIDPEVVGDGLLWMLVVTAYNDGQYEEAIEGARDFTKKPAFFARAATLMLKARQGLIAKLEDGGDKTQLAKAQADLEDNVKKLEAFLASQTDEKKREFTAVSVAVATTKIRAKIQAQKYDEVIADLGAEFWKDSSGGIDTDLATTMLKHLAVAVNKLHLRNSGVIDLKKDKPKVLPAAELAKAWDGYTGALRIFKKQSVRAAGGDLSTLRNASFALAQVAQLVSGQADAAAKTEPGEEIARVQDESKRFFADFIEPFIDDTSKPSLILSIAETLWEINEKGRAVRLYDLYKVSLDADEMVKSYRSDPDGTVKQFADIFTSRSEFKKQWEDIADRLTDPPGYLNDLITLSEEELRPKGKKRDYQEAVIATDALRKTIEGAGYLDAESKKKMGDAIERLRTMAKNLSFTIVIDGKMAEYYRENGPAEKAVELYGKLYKEYDPLDHRYSEGYVEGVIHALSINTVLSKDSISQAREVAGRNLRYFQARPADKDSYWLSYLQVFELSKYLDKSDLEAIKKNLQYNVVNKSTPRHDLISPAHPQDDARVSRARNKLAVDIAERYLALYDDVSLPRPFRIENLEGSGQSLAIFVDTDSPAMEAGSAPDEDGVDVLVIKASGTPAAQEATP